jgi:arylsulfatase A
MNRGKIFLTLVFIIGFVSLHAQKRIAKPNVVFIMADDLGYGDVGCYGQQLIKTPNIDRLAAGGTRFTQYYAGTSVCAPSRSSLMTGQHTGHTPVRGNYEIEPEGQLPIPDSAFTMAEMFKKAGYITGAFGKWGLGFIGSAGDPIKQGFDKFFGYNCQRQSHNYFPDHLWNNDVSVPLPNTLDRQTEYAPDLIQQQALQFVKENVGKPFFLYLAYTLPHAGLQLKEGDEDFEEYKKQFNEQPKAVKNEWNGVEYQPQPYPKAAYAAMVTKLDKFVGEVVNKLKALGIADNTLIVFTSDNGPHREGGNMPEFFNSSGGFRGIKRQLYEGGIREPMIAYWPAVIKNPSTSNQVSAAWDFFATFAELARQPVPKNTDGISLLPTIIQKGKQKQHDYLYWEFHEDGGRQAVRMGNWKGVRENVMRGTNHAIQLFDLSVDPKERKNVGDQHPDIVMRIDHIMQTQHVENKDFPFIRTTSKQ